MAAPASRMVQDQNLNIHSAARLDGLRTAKKGGATGGRKALGDISNSSKLSALASREQSSKNVISKVKDFTAPGGAAVGIGDKVPKPKAPVKGQSSGRKALGDLTNTNFVRSSKQNNVLKKAPIPSAIKDEQFLHNHEECIKGQRKGMQLKQFLEIVGLGSPPLLAPQAPNSQAESPVKNMEMKEIPEFSDIDQSCWSVYSSPVRDIDICNESWRIVDDTFVEFKLIESPKLYKS